MLSSRLGRPETTSVAVPEHPQSERIFTTMKIFLFLYVVTIWFITYTSGACPTVDVSTEMNIKSPGYPNAYETALKCKTRIHAPLGKVVQVTVLNMDLPIRNNGQCKGESVRIHDGTNGRAPRIARLCGTATGSIHVTTQPEAFVFFKSDTNDGGETGYRLRIRFIDTQGTTTSPPTTTSTTTTTTTATTPPGNFNWYSGECGQSQYTDAGTRSMAGPRIIGGQDARPGEFPWQIALVGATNRWLFCGGSVINERWVITAGHCMNGIMPSTRRVETGAHNIDQNPSGQTLAISESFLHPSFNPATFDYDISLLKLEADIQMSNVVQPICPPDAPQDYTNREVFVSGWGRTDNDFSPSILQFTNLEVISQVRCQSEFSSQDITDRMVCAVDDADETERDACQGDSGGPLMVKESNGRFKLVGLTSWGIGCADGTPGVYTRVTALLSWIQGIIDNN